MKKDEKDKLILEIASLIESDPNATPMSLDILNILSEEELISIKDNLVKAKNNKKEENEKWFDKLAGL